MINAEYFGSTPKIGDRYGQTEGFDGEITKLRPEAVCLETGMISVSAEVSKVREPRRVAIQPNLVAWLRAYPLGRFHIVVADFQKRRAKFSKRFGLTHDVLRHTFVAKFRSMGEAALQACNCESIIRKHTTST